MLREAVQDQRDFPGGKIRILARSLYQEDTLLRSLAKLCFLPLKSDYLGRLARFIGAAGNTNTEYTVCETLVNHCLPDFSADQRLSILALREVIDVANMDALLEVDAVLDVLTASDREKLEAEREKQQKRRAAVTEYSTTHRERCREHRDASGGGGGGGGPGSAGAAAPPDRNAAILRAEPGAAVDQATVRGFLPPGHSIWKDEKRGRWHFHPKPKPRFHTKWVDHGGESGAAWEGIKACWKSVHEQTCRPLSECPVRGLYDAAVEAAHPGTASSSGMSRPAN